MPDTLYNADDREAIAAVIHKETACFRNLDFDGWAACYLQSPRACTVSASPGLAWLERDPRRHGRRARAREHSLRHVRFSETQYANHHRRRHRLGDL